MPTITANNITITSSASGSSEYYIIGDEITVRWDNSSSSPGDNNSNLSAVTANFSEFGGGVLVDMTEDSGIYTATYTILSGSIDATNLNVFITATDNNSTPNVTTTESTINLSLDNNPPYWAESGEYLSVYGVDNIRLIRGVR